MLVEDHAPFRQAIAFILGREAEIELVAQAGTLGEARRVLAERELDVVILDLHLPDGDGNDLIGEIREAHPRVSVVVLSLFPEQAEEAGGAGADVVLGKDAVFEEVVGTIRRIGNG